STRSTGTGPARADFDLLQYAASGFGWTLRVGKRFESAGSQVSRRVQPRIEEGARGDVSERLQHRVLHARMLHLEIHEQLLDSLPLQSQIAARGTATPDNRQLALFGVRTSLVLAHEHQRTNHDMCAIVRHQL